MRLKHILLCSALLLSQAEALLQEIASKSGNSSLVCEDVHKIPKIDQCQFIRLHCDTEDHHIGLVNYLELHYCYRSTSFSTTIIISSLVFSFVSLGLTASDFLCPNLYSISKFLDLSDNLAGLTLLAIGNGSPDVLGTYKALSIGSTGLAVSELVGAALFILTVVVGSICIVSAFKVPKYHFIRDVSFYTTVSVLIWFSLVAGQFDVVNSTILTLLYVIYVIVAVYSHSWVRKNSRKHINDTVIRSHYDDEALVSVDDTMDQSYFDQHSSLPSIDVLSTMEREDLDASHEYVEYLKLHPLERSEERVPVGTGSYGMRVLLRELSKHSIHQIKDLPRLQLLDERPLAALDTTVTGPHDESQAEGSPFNHELTEQVQGDTNQLFKPQFTFGRLIRQFIPLFDEDESWLSRLTNIICLPANIILKLTTPNRESALVHGEHSATATNAFTFQLTTQTDTEEDFKDFDFEADVWLFRIQLVLGTLLLVVTFFNTLGQSWFVSIAFMTASCIMSLLIPNKAPRFKSHLIRFRMWNYFGSFFGFVLSLIWISFFATEIIAVIKAVAVVLELSDDILGSTVFALGNSIGDLVSNLTIARMGMPVMAFSACFGGPLLSLCSLGLSSLIVMSEKGESAIPVNFSPTLKLNLSTLLFSQLFIFAYLPRNGWMFDRRVGVILIAFWLFSVVTSLLLETRK